MLPAAWMLAAMLLLAGAGSLSPGHAQNRSGAEPRRPDSLGTRLHRDTTHVDADSLFRLSIPPHLGSVDPGLDSVHVVERSQLPWRDRRSLTGLLEYEPGFILHDQSSIGQYSAPTINGVDWRSIAFLLNGRPLTDPAMGIYNPSLAAPEYLDRIEIISGPRAFLYGLNGNGAVVNLVTRNYNSNRPFTKIVYSEGADGFRLSDGTFAQNITRRLNLTAGFQFQGTDGRFVNSNHEAWTFRGKLRYGLSEKLTLLLSENFTSTFTGLFGGINPARSSLAFIDPTQAIVVNRDAYEKITRHDLDLTAVGSFLPDSTSITTLTLYGSFSLREYRDEENRSFSNGIFVMSDHRSSWMGAHFTQSLALPLNDLLIGADMELRYVVGSPNMGQRRRVVASAWAKDEFSLGSAVHLAVYGRADGYMGFSRPGIGSDVRLGLAPSLTLFGGISASSRVPNFVELYWTDSTVGRHNGLSAERHLITEAGLEWTPRPENSVRLALTHRQIIDPILVSPGDRLSVFPSLTFANGDRIRLTSADLSLRLSFWYFLLEGTGTVFLDRVGGTVADDLPALWLYGGIYIRGDFLGEKLNLKGGVRGWFRSAHNGMLFNPEVLTYVPNTGPGLGKAATVDFVLNARLGDAYIHFIWENLPGIRYYTTPYYPGLDRAIRFGIEWEFWN